jgi:hypothetical protein
MDMIDMLDIITFYQNNGNEEVVNMLLDALKGYKEFLQQEEIDGNFMYSSTDDDEDDISEGVPEPIQSFTSNGFSQLI